MLRSIVAGRSVLALLLVASTPAHTQAVAPDTAGSVAPATPTTLRQVEVTAAPTTSTELPSLPGRHCGRHLATTVQEMIDVVNRREDALKYLPSLIIRKRHIGDVQDPLETRTSGLGQSARSLIYADGVLLSALIGNNNTTASPRWGMVAPVEVSRVDVMYGPFAAGYPGNSMGAVVEITTRMPQQFEATAEVLGATQQFKQYGTSDHYNAFQATATIGSCVGDFRLTG